MPRPRRSCGIPSLAIPCLVVLGALPSVACRARATDLAVGTSHVCALRGEGEVVCWGGSREFEGNAAGLAGHLPAFAASLEEPVGLGAGRANGCAVLASGRVACWSGGNSLISHSARFEPLGGSDAPYGLIEGIEEARQVALGEGHACARVASGHVWCWGSTSRGQLGTPPSRELAGIERVSGVEAAVDVTVGRYHSCAVRQDGALLCWGAPRGPSESERCASTFCSPRVRPTSAINLCPEECPEMPDHSLRVIEGVSDAVEATAGDTHTCARRRDGTVLCFGQNGLGQLGAGNRRSTSSVVPVAGLGDVAEVAAGADHTCARRGDGTVLCWGAGESGQLGNGGTGARDRPVQVPGLEGVVQISAGGSISCARYDDGRVSCWGANRSAELGVPSMQDEPRPVEAEAVWRVLLPGGRRVNVGRGCFVTCSVAE